jgi:hypothetical protein
MAHYALVDDSNLVLTVIVSEVDPENFEHTQQMAADVFGRWIQTSYNTRLGVHFGPDGLPDGGVALRGNYASAGFTYSPELDAFLPPKPYPSWVLDREKFDWKSPVDYPNDEKPIYKWDEETISWKESEQLLARYLEYINSISTQTSSIETLTNSEQQPI